MNNAGQSVTGMGVLAAVAVLILLIVVIRVFAKLRRAQGEHDAKVEEAAPVREAAAQAAPVAPVVEEGIAPEIVAAIAAAIAALDAGHKALVVRSIRRADGWSKSARAEQIYRF